MSNIIDNKNHSRFELTLENHLCYADYHIEGEALYIDYVFAPPELRGKGAAGALMQGIVEIAESKDLKVIPICSYAVSWMKRKGF